MPNQRYYTTRDVTIPALDGPEPVHIPEGSTVRYLGSVGGDGAEGALVELESGETVLIPANALDRDPDAGGT